MRKLLAALALAAIPALPAAASPLYPSFTVQTGQSGANTGLNQNVTRSWSFVTGTQPWAFAGGLFQMKDGPKTTAALSLSLYEGAVATGTPLAQVTLSNAQFDAQAPNPQRYSPIALGFAAPLLLAANTQYVLTLASPAQPNRDYFIKGANEPLRFTDAQGNLMTAGYIASGAGHVAPPPTLAPAPTPVPAPDPTAPAPIPVLTPREPLPPAPPPLIEPLPEEGPIAVPEPAGLALLPLGLAALVLAQRRRRGAVRAGA